MATSMVVAKAVVILDVHDQPLSQIMKRLADAIGGSWKHEKDLYRLVRDASEQRQMEAAERAHRTEQIAAEIATSKEIRDASLTPEKAKDVVGQLAKLREKNPNYAFNPYGDLRGPLNLAPARLALLRLISSMDAGDFAMLEQGDRIAFSNKPTPMEQPLPSGVDEILSKFAAEQNSWADAVNALHGANEDQGGGRFGGDPLNETESVSQPPDRLLLIANRSNSSAPVNFTLYIISNGVAIASSNLWLGSDTLRQASRQMSSESGTTETKIPSTVQTQRRSWKRLADLARVTLAPFTRAFLQLLSVRTADVHPENSPIPFRL